MKRLYTITLASALMIALLTGCSCTSKAPSPTKATETSQTATTEIKAGTEISQQEPPKITTTDEFPTESDVEENSYIEPGGRWSVNVADSWYEYGDIIEDSKGSRVKFVYKKAYEEYGAGNVFTIYTNKSSNAVDVSELPHAKELHLDSNIQIYVEYPTDVQCGGIDGSEMEEQAPEYNALYDIREDIIDSLEVLV